MSYPDLELKVEKLRSDYWKIKERLNKLENGRDDKVMPEGVDFSHTIPGKGYETATAKIDLLASQKEVALDWYINQYQNMCKEYSNVKIKLDEKQKVLEMVMDQRGRYVKQLMDTEKKVKELAAANYDFNKTNQMLRGTIENFKDRILELEEEVKYHKAFAGSEKIKKLELDIKYLEDKNRFISDLNDEYRKMIVNDENKNSSPYVFVVLFNGEPEAIFNSKEAAFKFTEDFVKRVGYEHNYILIVRYEINTNVSVVVGAVNTQGEVVDE